MKHFLRLEDFGKQKLHDLIKQSVSIKRDPQKYARVLAGKKIGLLFEKPSLRTRVSCDIALNELGAYSLYLSPAEVQLGKRESINDAAQTLSQYLDGVVLRTFAHEGLEEFSRCSTIPVVNGLSDRFHPLQILGDIFTMMETKGKVSGLKVAYIGDGNNICNTLLAASGIFGFTMAVSSPAAYKPGSREALDQEQWPGNIVVTTDPRKAAEDADVVYTDVWVSMGMERQTARRKKIFKKYQINSGLLSHARRDCIVMHCLPAHRGEEITDEVMESKQSVVFQQAENRLHTQKAVFMEVFK